MKIAVIGVNGKLGKPIIKTLKSSGLFDSIRALTHSACGDLDDNIEVYKISTDEPDSLTNALTGVDILVNTASSRSNHQVIADQAVKAGVQVYFPSDFDMDFALTPFHTVFKSKLLALEYASSKPWKCIQIKCGFFGEYMLYHSFNMGLDVESGVYTQIGDGNSKVAVTFMEDVGKAVAEIAILAAKNAKDIPDVVRIKGDVITANEYVELYEQCSGKSFERKSISKDEALVQAEKINAKSSIERVEKFQVIQTLPCLGYTDFENDDNNLLTSSSNFQKFHPIAKQVWSDSSFSQESGL